MVKTPSVQVADDDSVDGLPRHQQLIVSLFGLYARDHDQAIAVSALIALLGELGAEASAVRSSVSRLKKRGVLHATRANNQAAYRLVDTMADIFAEGDRRIFYPVRAESDDPWLLAAFSVPEAQRHLRHRIRSLFTRRGFGSVTPGLWIAPSWLLPSIQAQLERDGLADYVEFFSAESVTSGDLATKVARWWDLPALAELYENFLQRWDPVRRRWAATDLGRATAEELPELQRAAFADHLTLITQWRRFPYLDPGLPLEHLPQPWPGQSAADLFAELNQRLAPLAEAHAAGVLGTLQPS